MRRLSKEQMQEETPVKEQEQQEPTEDTEPEQSPQTTAESQPEPAKKSSPAEPEKTPEQLLQEEVDQLSDKLLRTMAEYDNFRKRSQRERDAIYPQATASAVGQFVPILDTFERALSAPCSDEEFKKGVEMILQNFKETLEKLGVESFGEAGETFDPNLHNAVMHIEDPEKGEGVIVEVFQRGYKMGDRIIRHAMVQVAN